MRSRSLEHPPQPLQREQRQHQDHEEKGVLEDAPGDAQILALAGKHVKQHERAERHGNCQADDADDQHSGRLAQQSGNAGRDILGALEAHRLQCRRLGKQRAQQAVVQCVPGLVGAEGAEQRLSEQIQVADRV